MKPEDAKIYMSVRYRPSSVSDRYFVGTIDSEPFQCGETWCVRLTNMPADYGVFCGKKGHKSHCVSAAALANCEPHVSEQEQLVTAIVQYVNSHPFSSQQGAMRELVVLVGIRLEDQRRAETVDELGVTGR